MEHRVLSYPRCQFCTGSYDKYEANSLKILSDYNTLPNHEHSFLQCDNILCIV